MTAALGGAGQLQQAANAAQAQADVANAGMINSVNTSNANRDTQGKSSGMGALGSGLGMLTGLALAPMTGGTSLLGSAMSGMSGMTSGKGGTPVSSGSVGANYYDPSTTGLGGYRDIYSILSGR